MSSFSIDTIKKDEILIYLIHLEQSFDEDDFLSVLNDEEKEKFNTFISSKRKKEFVAVRILKEKFLQNSNIEYNHLGAPFLVDSNKFISISHANNLVGIAVNNYFPIGFDIELIHEKVLRLFHKYVNENEKIEFDCTSVEELIAIWSMKESLYKLSGQNGLDFKANFELKKIDSNSVKGKIIFSNEKKEVNLHYFKYKSYFISFNTSSLK